MAKPIDSRLVKQAGPVRTLVITLGLIAGVRSLLWVVIAVAMATLVVGVRDGAPIQSWAGISLLTAMVLRPLMGYVAEQLARNQAAQTKHDLRMRALRASQTNGDQSTGQITAMVTTGADALDEWFARFLPSALEGVIMPGVMIITIGLADPISLIVLGVTVPLLGVFGWLIGVETRDQADKQYAAMTRLSGHFLDLLRGLETLRLFGVAQQQEELVRHVADDLRHQTMITLRIAFMSALALELIAMIGTALIAVIIGIRLSYGMMDLLPGLAVLIMAPEAYLPIRRVGATFHASTEGASAGAALLDAIDAIPSSTGQPETMQTATSWALDQVSVVRDGRVNLHNAQVHIERGQYVALAGQSGSGKSTILGVLAGLVPIDGGNVLVDGKPTEMQPATPGVVWLPQHPVILASSLRENLILGKDIDDNRIAHILTRCGASSLISRLYEPIGQGGTRLSGGEAKRVGLARALLANPVLLLADEPTTEVDEATSTIIRTTLADLATDGVAVLVATHDQIIMGQADAVITLNPLHPQVQSPREGEGSIHGS